MSAITKADFAKWFLSLGGAASWFGTDHVNRWAAGDLGSAVFDEQYKKYEAGDQKSVIGYVQAHTGLAMPAQFQDWKNNTVYAGVINLLTADLAHYQTQQQNLHGTVDDTPLANQANSANIVRTQQALAYYKGLAGQK